MNTVVALNLCRPCETEISKSRACGGGRNTTDTVCTESARHVMMPREGKKEAGKS